MKTAIFNPRNMGAIPTDGAVHFRVWAPHAEAVSVIGEFNDWNAEMALLNRGDGGMWVGEVAGAKVGQQYQFEIINGEQRLQKNDAYAREIHAESGKSVIYSDNFKWSSPPIVLAHWNELVLYELHVGNFAAGPHGSPGRFEQVIRRLPYLKSLGINALEIMPPMAFPGERSWGYNLTNPFAVDGTYGGPDGLKRLVDAAHKIGIGVILDIVYNHFGPDKLDLWQYDGWSENGKGGIYFYNDHRAWTPWGENRPDYGRGEVRQYLRDNALLWIDEFHVDGLRVDATLFIRNSRGENNKPETDIPEGWTLMQWINDEVSRLFPGRILIGEDLQQNDWITKPTKEGGLGFHTQWDPAFVHPVRGAVVALDDANRSMEDVARAIEFRYNNDAIQRVIYSESHDSVANGQARIPQEIDPGDTSGYYAKKRSTLAAGLVMTTPGIPMIFEGQEFLESGWFRDDVTVDWSKLETFNGIHRMYRDLIYLRRNHYGNTRGLTGPYVRVLHFNENDKIIGFHRWFAGGAKDDVVVIASFSHEAKESDYRIGLPRRGSWKIRFNSDWKGYSPEFHDVSNEEGVVEAVKGDFDFCDYNGTIKIPAYGVLILSQDNTGKPGRKPEPDLTNEAESP